MTNSRRSSFIGLQLPSAACKICLLILVLLSGGFKSYSLDKEPPQSENPFVPVLRDIAGASDGKGAEILLDGKKIFGSKKKTVEEGKGPFQIKQYNMGPVDGLAAVQTAVMANHPETPYLLSMFNVNTGGRTVDLQVSYPLDPGFEPMTWEFDNGTDDYRCDLLLYDRRLENESYDKSHGINLTPLNRVALKPGTPLMLIRIIYANLNTRGFKTHPVIRSDGKGKRLVVPLFSADPKIRVLFFPIRNQKQQVTTVQKIDFSKSELRFGNMRDIYKFAPGSDNFTIASISDGTPPVNLGVGMPYSEPPEPKGSLIAQFDFESLNGKATKDVSGTFEATVEDGILVDGGILGGKCLYLGKRREVSKAKIIVPKSVREKFDKDQFTMSAWLKIPWGQLGQNDLTMWPYRRGAEGLEKPFASAWNFGMIGELNIAVSRWDAYDVFRLGGFGNKFHVETTVQLRPPGWQHVAVTAEKDQVKIYFNGKLSSEATTPKAMTLASFRQGGDLIFMTNFWGMVDKLRIHDFALSEKQIADMVSKDLPSTLLHYPLETVKDGFTPCIPPGDFPVDAWDWNARDFKKEISFAAGVGAAKVVEGRNGKGLQLDGQGVIIPPKALMDLGINRISVAFWFKPESDKGGLISSRGHPKHGFNIVYSKSGIWGVLCSSYDQLTVKQGISAGIWHHFIFCFDNQEIIMYLDGKQIKKQPYIPNLQINLKDGLAVGVGVKGVFDDIRIFSRMITEKETKDLF